MGAYEDRQLKAIEGSAAAAKKMVTELAELNRNLGKIVKLLQRTETFVDTDAQMEAFAQSDRMTSRLITRVPGAHMVEELKQSSRKCRTWSNGVVYHVSTCDLENCQELKRGDSAKNPGMEILRTPPELSERDFTHDFTMGQYVRVLDEAHERFNHIGVVNIAAPTWIELLFPNGAKSTWLPTSLQHVDHPSSMHPSQPGYAEAMKSWNSQNFDGSTGANPTFGINQKQEGPE